MNANCLTYFTCLAYCSVDWLLHFFSIINAFLRKTLSHDKTGDTKKETQKRRVKQTIPGRGKKYVGKEKYNLSGREPSPFYSRMETSKIWWWKCVENHINLLSLPKKKKKVKLISPWELLRHESYWYNYMEELPRNFILYEIAHCVILKFHSYSCNI